MTIQAPAPETPEENSLNHLERQLKKMKVKHPTDFSTLVSANGYFEAGYHMQLQIAARIICDITRREQQLPLVEQLLENKNHHNRAMAVTLAYHCFGRQPFQAGKIFGVFKQSFMAGPEARQASAWYLRRLLLEQGVNQVLPRLNTLVKALDDEGLATIIEAVRPRGRGGQLPELKENPLPLRALLEPCIDTATSALQKAVLACINDIATDQPATVARWVNSWHKPSMSNERSRLIQQALKKLVKVAEPEALKLAGFQDATAFKSQLVQPLPGDVYLEEPVTLVIDLENKSKTNTRAQLLLRLRYQLNEKLVQKFLPFLTFSLGPAENRQVKKTFDLSARVPVNECEVSLLLNGQVLQSELISRKTE